MKVLIVEDNDMIASLIAEQVAELGYEVCATDPTKAHRKRFS